MSTQPPNPSIEGTSPVRYVTNALVAVEIGVPWTFAVVSLGHAEVPSIIGVLLAPGTMIGYFKHLVPWSGIQFAIIVTVQLLYYIFLSALLQRIVRRLFFTSDSHAS
jgi:hypothetical protein